ncbi:NAD(P)-binding protein [Kitasatospora sp. NPDC048296]|uniref:NAD(P)-binding protein n=1 Tax=Kitasatospora sp. NPDC048296 TaxID=3364048 RepID=UPI0037196ACB
MAGLTAAMELAERGFAVTVVEPAGWGGKARSASVPGTGTGGRLDLPSVAVSITETLLPLVFGTYARVSSGLPTTAFLWVNYRVKNRI